MEMVKEMKSVYDLLLSVPGMNDVVKLDLKLPRKNVLFWCQLLSRTLEDKDNPLIAVMPKEVVDELQTTIADSLEKSGLSALVPKLKMV